MTLSKLLSTLSTGTRLKLTLVSYNYTLVDTHDHNFLSAAEAYDYVKAYRPSTFKVQFINMVDDGVLPYLHIHASRY